MFDYPPPGADPIHDDLKARWRPSDRQVEQATAYLKEHPEARDVFTLHLLVNKIDHFWTTDVEVEHLNGQDVLTDRNEASMLLSVLVKERAQHTSKPLVGCWTRHWLHEGEPGWAVFDDCLSVANQPEGY